MTKEEAKLVLDNARPQTKEIDRQFYDDEDLNNALDIAIKALEQQPSDDCVSRQAVLKGYIEIERADGVEVYSDRVIPKEYVEALPPVTPAQSWIPVSERLPDAQKDGDKDFSDWVQVTINLGKDNSLCVSEAYYCFSTNKWYTKRFVIGEVIAWQPLPQPYEEKRGDEDGSN